MADGLFVRGRPFLPCRCRSMSPLAALQQIKVARRRITHHMIRVFWGRGLNNTIEKKIRLSNNQLTGWLGRISVNRPCLLDHLSSGSFRGRVERQLGPCLLSPNQTNTYASVWGVMFFFLCLLTACELDHWQASRHTS